MRVSVVLTVYNGSKYITKQLESIYMQSYKVDEVLILDDCSTDNSVQIIREFISNYDLSNWQIISNSNNLGWKKNFKKGFDLATGDLIFPSDQDDIWHKDKIKTMVYYMSRNIRVNLLASNYTVKIDGGKNKSHKSQIKKMRKYKSGNVYMLDFNYDWISPRRPGCTYCFKKSFYDLIKNEWDTSEPHDSQLWTFASLYDSLAICGDSLIEFRRHGDNATEKDGTNYKSRLDAANLNILRIKKYSKYLSDHGLMNQEKATKIKKLTQYEKLRIDFMKTRKIKYMLVLVLKYRECYYTTRSILGDIYYTFKNN